MLLRRWNSRFIVMTEAKEQACDLLVIGGGLGGISASLAAARLNKRVIMTEEYDWIGGQLTAQGVPFDEHHWMEKFGCTHTYRQLRDYLREYYRNHYPLTHKARNDRYLNPGAALVNRLCVEPKAALNVLEAMLAPYQANGQITVLRKHKPIHVENDGDYTKAVTLINQESGNEISLSAPFIVDATEKGELLKLGNVEYVTGRESQKDTGELHAVEGPARPQEMQAFTFVYAMDYVEGENHVIDKPSNYDFWRAYQASWEIGRHLSWKSKSGADHVLFPNDSGSFSLWQYRRILYKGNFEPGFLQSDVTLFNTALNDYWLGSVIDVTEDEIRKNHRAAKQLSLSTLYWLQTEAPRPDGGLGWPGLRLRKDILNTEDGMAKSPYIRESRRIKAEFTVIEEHIGLEQRKNKKGAEIFPDTVGIGCYRMDLHPRTGGHPGIMDYTWPFQIPLGALLPIRVENLLPGCKNIGVTHNTNGSFRLHPVEWNIGEAVGTLSAYCLDKGLMPRQVRNNKQNMSNFQSVLLNLGFELEWPNIGIGDTYHKWAIKRSNWHFHETDKMNLY